MGFKLNPITTTDSYKLSHADMYEPGTEIIYSNFTPRSNAHFNIPAKYKTNKIVNYGEQGVFRQMAEEWKENFFDKDEKEMMDFFVRRTAPFSGDYPPDVERMRQLHKLGYLPIRVKALPEGARVNIGVPVFTINNTLPEFFWLTNYLESYLSEESWKMMTIATIADTYRKVIDSYADETGGSKEFVDFQGHDFSMRGIDGSLSAAKGGSAHLLSFKGTDTLGAVDYLEYYYGAEKSFVAASVPASEHSVMCLGGEMNEKETIRRLIEDVYPTGIVSVVSDSWDFWNVISKTSLELKDVIMNRKPDSMGFNKVVFRPDSGDPVRIICGDEIIDYTNDSNIDSFVDAIEFMKDELLDRVVNKTDHGECGGDSASGLMKYKDKYYKVNIQIDWNRYDKQYYYEDGHSLVSADEVVPTPEQLGAVEVLWNIFGGTVNDKGYKTLDQHVGLIYGDSITIDRADQILSRLKDKGFASDNIVFGIGSYTYQYLTRDTLGFAMKATFGIVKGKPVEIFKNPKTDSGTKKSAKGLLRVEKEGDDYVLYDQQNTNKETKGELKLIFRDGEFYNTTTLDEIRDRLKNG
jgi:nicotinamide phosphoribosyltransferase